VRAEVGLGGDTYTLASIAGPVAELSSECLMRSRNGRQLAEVLRQVLNRIDKRLTASPSLRLKQIKRAPIHDGRSQRSSEIEQGGRGPARRFQGGKEPSGGLVQSAGPLRKRYRPAGRMDQKVGCRLYQGHDAVGKAQEAGGPHCALWSVKKIWPRLSEGKRWA
jgi:hypothetical protein